MKYITRFLSLISAKDSHNQNITDLTESNFNINSTNPYSNIPNPILGNNNFQLSEKPGYQENDTLAKDNPFIETLDTANLKTFDQLLEDLRWRESSNQYDNAKNTFGYLGAYQLGEAALVQTGYYKAGATGSYGSPGNTKYLGWNLDW